MTKCCLFSGSGNYVDMEQQLTLFVDRFEFEREIRPWMTPYRDWSLFILDTQGMKPSHELDNLDSLARLVKSFPARIIGIWSFATWERLKTLDPQAAYSPNVVMLDSPDWCQKLDKALRRYHRRLRNIKDGDDSTRTE